MPKPIDLTGKILGKLKIESRFSEHKQRGSVIAYYNCKCNNCEETLVKRSQDLLKGRYNCTNKECNRKDLGTDYIGSKYGILTIESYSHCKKERFYYNCKCECGNNCVKAIDSLKNSTLSNCGCKTSELRATMKGKPAANRLNGNQGARNSLFSRYKAGAIQRSFNFDLDQVTFENLTSQSCYYCGIGPSKRHPSKVYKGSEEDSSRFYWYNGLDRVDSSKGYSKDNLVPCCSDCNYAKQETSVKDFLSHVERVYLHQKKLKP